MNAKEKKLIKHNTVRSLADLGITNDKVRLYFTMFKLAMITDDKLLNVKRNKKGKPHCDDGPVVIIRRGGVDVLLWALEGRQMINMDVFLLKSMMSDEDKVIFKLRYSQKDFC